MPSTETSGTNRRKCLKNKRVARRRAACSGVDELVKSSMKSAQSSSRLKIVQSVGDFSSSEPMTGPWCAEGTPRRFRFLEHSESAMGGRNKNRADLGRPAESSGNREASGDRPERLPPSRFKKLEDSSAARSRPWILGLGAVLRRMERPSTPSLLARLVLTFKCLDFRVTTLVSSRTRLTRPRFLADGELAGCRPVPSPRSVGFVPVAQGSDG
jgi:hypothetical protein